MPERAAAATASVDMPGWSACSGKQTASKGSTITAAIAGQIEAKEYAAGLAMLKAHHESSVHADLQLILWTCYRAQQEQWWQVHLRCPGGFVSALTQPLKHVCNSCAEGK